MTSTAPDLATFRLSTCILPGRDRAGYSREVIGQKMQKILRLDVEPAPDQPFRSRSAGPVRPNLIIVWGVTGGLGVSRTAEHIADGNDAILMPLTVEGSGLTLQRGREPTVGDGDAIVTLSSDRAWVTFSTRLRNVSIGLPRKTFVPLVPRLEDVLMRPIPQHNVALRLLKGYVNTLGETPVPATPEFRRLVVAHIQDLVALMIDATWDAAAIVKGCGLRTARLEAIKADVIGHLRQPELTVGAVAARQHVSARYVQMLFETEGTTFSHFVLGQRLLLAHRMLTDRRYDAWTIGAIAMEAGFGDLSYFNHAFRRLYAASPSDVRAAVRRTAPRDEVVHEPKATWSKVE